MGQLRLLWLKFLREIYERDLEYHLKMAEIYEERTYNAMREWGPAGSRKKQEFYDKMRDEEDLAANDEARINRIDREIDIEISHGRRRPRDRDYEDRPPLSLRGDRLTRPPADSDDFDWPAFDDRG